MSSPLRVRPDERLQFWLDRSKSVFHTLASRVLNVVRHPLLFSLLLGTIVRLALAPWTEQRWDSYIDRLMGAYVIGYGISPLIPEKSCACLPILNFSYPPLWLFFLVLAFRVWQLLTGFQFPPAAGALWAQGLSSGNIFQAYRSFVPGNLPLLDLMFKSPIIVSDAAIGYLIWAIAGKTKRAARVSLFGWLLNPYAITVSAVWGEFDSIAILFMLLSIYYLLQRKTVKSAFWLGMGTSTKIFPGLLLPSIILFLVINRRDQTARYLLGFATTTVAAFSSLLLFPYPIEYISRLLVGRATPNFNGTTIFSGLSWTVVLNALPSPPQIPLVLILLPLTLTFVIVPSRRHLQEEYLLVFLAASLLCIYLSYPTINVQYPLWAVPMLSILAIQGKIRKSILAIFSAIPALMLYTAFNPIYFISPALIFDENNYPPASDVVQQLWNFPVELFPLLTASFTVIIIIAIWTLVKFLARGEAVPYEAPHLKT